MAKSANTQQNGQILTLTKPNLPDSNHIQTDPTAWQAQLNALQEVKTSLSTSFVKALQEDFAEHGPVAIEAVRHKNPGQYLRLIAQIMPKEVQIDVHQHDPAAQQLADDTRLRFLRSLVTTQDGGGPHADGGQPVHGDLPPAEPTSSED